MDRSRSVLKKSAACALAGTAFGVPAAEAAPIYFDAPDTIYRADATTPVVNVLFDIDGDSVDDYSLDLLGGTDAYAYWTSLGSNSVVSTHLFDVEALGGGALVGPAQSYKTNSQLAKMKADGTTGGQWPSNLVDPRFVGLQFLIGGQTHYGWARVGVDVDGTAGVAQGVVYRLGLRRYPRHRDHDAGNRLRAGALVAGAVRARRGGRRGAEAPPSPGLMARTFPTV